MTFLCAQCGKPVGRGDRVCPNPNCREPQDVRSVFKRWLEGMGIGVRRATAVRCPACNAVGSLEIGYCMKCGCNFTVAAAIAPLLRGPRRLWDRWKNKFDSMSKQRFQRYFFWLSVFLFLAVLSIHEHFQPNKWGATALVAIIFLPLLLLLVLWLKPKRDPRAPRPPPLGRIVKLALVFNYFSVLLLIELLVGVWLEKAVIIAVQCVVTLVAFYCFATFFWPVWVALGEFFREQARAQFDPTSYQGRRARSDFGERGNT
jgi:hypothetical protein